MCSQLEGAGDKQGGDLTKILEIKNVPAPTFVFQVGWGRAHVIENWWGVGGQQIQCAQGKKNKGLCAEQQ